MSELEPIGNNLNDVINKIPLNNEPNNTNDDDNNKIQFEQRKCKVLRDLIEFNQGGNCLNSTTKKYKGEVYIMKELKSIYGNYRIKMPRAYTLMDYKVLLLISYLTDFFKDRFFTVNLSDVFDLLNIEIKKTSEYYDNYYYYRRKIIEGIDYFKNSTYYTPYIWDLDKNKRSDDIPLTKKGKIKWNKLSSLSVWSVINSYHLKNFNGTPTITVEISKEFYERFHKYYILIDFKRVLSLKNPTSLNLYLFLQNNWGIKRTHKYSIGFEKLKKIIGITDTNESRAKDTFKSVWSDIKKRGLLSYYNNKQELLAYLTYSITPSKTGKENIHFKFVDVLRA